MATDAARGVTLTSDSPLDRLPPIRTVGRERQLFVDDYHIAIMDNLSRFIHRPEKRKDNPVFVMEEPWEGERFHYCDLVYDRGEKIYKLWYAVAPQTPADMCYAVSEDGIHFERPNLGLLEVDGSRDHNIIFRGYEAHNFCAFRDDSPNAPPEHRYKAVGGSCCLAPGRLPSTKPF